MAQNVGVLRAGQRADSRPMRHVTRSIAELMVQRLVARRLSECLIQLLALETAIPIRTVAGTFPRIPHTLGAQLQAYSERRSTIRPAFSSLASPEIPGLKYSPPRTVSQKKQWQQNSLISEAFVYAAGMEWR